MRNLPTCPPTLQVPKSVAIGCSHTPHEGTRLLSADSEVLSHRLDANRPAMTRPVALVEPYDLVELALINAYRRVLSKIDIPDRTGHLTDRRSGIWTRR